MASQKTIGILLPVLNAGYDMAILAGAHAIARQRGAQLIALWMSPGELRATQLARERVDGWIAVHNIPRPDDLLEIARTSAPLVAIGASVPNLGIPSVLPDNLGGTLAAVRHLLDHGHRRIAFIGDLRVDDMRERYAGYQAALAERNIPLDSQLVFGDARYYGAAPGAARVTQQLIDGQLVCSAIVAGNDLYALAVLQSLQTAGYQVPEDLAVVGFDDLVEAQCATPPLTTVHQSYPLLGRVAAGLLLDQLRGQDVPSGPTYVPTALIVRRSCGCTAPQIFPRLDMEDMLAAPDWQGALVYELEQLAAYPLPIDRSTQPALIWPGAIILVQELEAAITDASPSRVAETARAWREAVALTADVEAHHAMLQLLERAGEQRAAAGSAAARARVHTFVERARLELMRAQRAHTIDRDTMREELVRANYAISMILLGQVQDKIARLTWLNRTPLRWACLGLWQEPSADAARTLVVAGAYSRDGEPTLPLGARYAAAAFPPLDALPAAARADGLEVAILLPVRSATHDWGILAVCRPIESRAAQSTDEDVRMWATLLGAALERESLLESLTGEPNSAGIAYEQRLITENIRDLIFMIDQAGRFLFASPSFQHVLGYDPARLRGFAAFDLIHPEDVATLQVPWAQVSAPSSVEATFRFRHADSSWRWLEVVGRVVIYQGSPVVVVVGRDISERKRLEADILQSQKMESIGRLAGGVAHDFNNLLTVITGYSDLIIESLSSTDPIRSDLEEIQKAARRATSLTSQLLAFARKQMIDPRVLNLNDLILNLDRLLRRLIGEDIELVTSPAPDLKQVKVDRGQIEQLLINLAINARDAMPDGGRLIIQTTNAARVQIDRYADLGTPAGSYVRLIVKDTGVGMDAEVQAHLFEPFFTTKGPGKGTGLGLATCYGIVKQHGGHISIHSAVGQGTTVRILLPAVEERATAPPSRDGATDIAAGAETVLLVEDEAAVRSLAGRVLRAQGYTVLEASGGEEALRLAHEHGEPIHLLLTDVVMPRIGGKAVAERLMLLRPEIKVLFMSGYTGQNTNDRGEGEVAVAFLQKPFSPDVLVRKVREVLDA